MNKNEIDYKIEKMIKEKFNISSPNLGDVINIYYMIMGKVNFNINMINNDMIYNCITSYNNNDILTDMAINEGNQEELEELPF